MPSCTSLAQELCAVAYVRVVDEHHGIFASGGHGMCFTSAEAPSSQQFTATDAHWKEGHGTSLVLTRACPNTAKAKEAKWEAYKEKLLKELAALQAQEWVVGYTNGSAKRVRGWMQASLRRRFHNTFTQYSESNTTTRWCAGQHSVQDSVEFSFTDTLLANAPKTMRPLPPWLENIVRGGGTSPPVGTSPMASRGGRDLVQIRWVLSHLNVAGSKAADELACDGRQKHPNNLLPLSKRCRVEWDELGLGPMVEAEELQVTSHMDLGGGGGCLVSEVKLTLVAVGFSTVPTVRNSAIRTSVKRGCGS